MQLSTHTDFSLRVLTYLALHKEQRPATVQEMAKAYGISANHVAKVAQTLVQHGYVRSLRGRNGGLMLALPPADIRIGAVVRAIENLTLLECFGTGSSCPIEPACQLKMIVQKAQQAFLATLDEYTLADLIGQRETLENLLFMPAKL